MSRRPSRPGPSRPGPSRSRPARFRLPRVAAAAGLLAAALAALPVASVAETQNRVFDVSVGGIRAGQLTLSSERNGTSYRTGSTIRATGILGALSRFRYEGSSTGEVRADGEVVPSHHSARSRTGGTDRRTELAFEGGNPAAVSVDPPRRRQADPAAHPGTIDPVSAAYALLLDTRSGSVCNRRLDLFDGYRRSELLVGRAEPHERGLVCNGRYARLTGGGLPTTDEAEWGFRLFYRPTENGSVELVRIEAPTRYGTAVVTPRS